MPETNKENWLTKEKGITSKNEGHQVNSRVMKQIILMFSDECILHHFNVCAQIHFS